MLTLQPLCAVDLVCTSRSAPDRPSAAVLQSTQRRMAKKIKKKVNTFLPVKKMKHLCMTYSITHKKRFMPALYSVCGDQIQKAVHSSSTLIQVQVHSCVLAKFGFLP